MPGLWYRKTMMENPRLWLLLCLLVIAPVVQASEPVLLVLGDSLSSGHGIDREQGWVSLLQKRLEEGGYRYKVINASISGDTTLQGLRRLPQLLQRYQPAILVIELGGNDGLRGIPVTQIRENIADMLKRAQQQSARVLLLGMRLPPNYGPAYTRAFEQLYAELARQFDTAFVPFFLQGVESLEWMQSDGIHPRAEAQARLLENVWAGLHALLPDPLARTVRPARTKPAP